MWHLVVFMYSVVSLKPLMHKSLNEGKNINVSFFHCMQVKANFKMLITILPYKAKRQ